MNLTSFDQFCQHPNLVSYASILKPVYEMVLRAHGSKRGIADNLFFEHPIATAMVIADWDLGPNLVIAALLHDVLDPKNVEKPISITNIEAELNNCLKNSEINVDTAFIIKTISKLKDLGHIQDDYIEYRDFENFGKRIWRSQDLGVMMIKLASALEVAEKLPDISRRKEKISRAGFIKIAYGTVAEQLGIWFLKRRLDDLCDLALEPERAHLFGAWRDEALKEMEEYREKIGGLIGELGKTRLIPHHVSSLVKRYQDRSSILPNKLSDFYPPKPEPEILSVGDAFRILITVPTFSDCYKALGLIHEMGYPVPGHLKDYLAVPKANGYASLDTIIFFEKTKLEINIRTSLTDAIATHGAADPDVFRFLTQNINKRENYDIPERLQGAKRSMTALLKSLQEKNIDLEGRLVVKTPTDQSFILSRGATALDMAYSVHTSLGERFDYALVNDRKVNMGYELQDGDVVKIFANQNNRPNLGWLSFAKTDKAQQQIKSFLKQEPGLRGRVDIESALRQAGLDWDNPEIQEHLTQLAKNYGSIDALIEAVGKNKKKPSSIIHELSRRIKSQYWFERLMIPGELVPILKNHPDSIKLANCCKPVYPGRIVGVHADGKLVVHEYGCNKRMQAKQSVDLDWRNVEYLNITIELEGGDRPNLVRDVTNVISNQSLAMSEFTAHVDSAKRAHIRMEIKAPNEVFLGNLLNDLKAVELIVNAQAKNDGQLITFDAKQPNSNDGVQRQQHFYRPNPYSPGTPIKSQSMFFGRKRELRHILEALQDNHKRIPPSMIFCAARRTGKTSLVNRLEQDPHIRRNYISTFIDLAGFSSGQSDSQLLNLITNRLYHQIQKIDPTFIISLHDYKDDPYNDFENDIENIKSAFLKQRKQSRFLFILDEFDAMISLLNKGSLSDRFLRSLRSWTQHLPVTFVLAGSSKIQSQLAQILPEFLNVFVSSKLGPLEIEDARSLIVEPTLGVIYYKIDAEDEIIALTKRYPYYIHVLCHKLYELATSESRSTIHLSDVNNAANSLSSYHSRGYFDFLWEPYNPVQKQVLSCLTYLEREAHENGVDEIALVEKILEQPKKSFDIEMIDKELYQLVETDTLEKKLVNERIYYRIRHPLFKMWLRANEPFAIR